MRPARRPGGVRPHRDRRDQRNGGGVARRPTGRRQAGAAHAAAAAVSRLAGCARAAPCRRRRGVGAMTGPLVSILDGNTFVVSDVRGDIEASTREPCGLFSYDTRFLSTWVLKVDGERLSPLSTDDLHYFETRFFLVPGTTAAYVDAKRSVIRQRALADGFREELTVLNHDENPAELTVRIEVECDFADLFEVRDALARKRRYTTRVEDGRPLTFTARIDPHGSWTTQLLVAVARVLSPGQQDTGPMSTVDRAGTRQGMLDNVEQWV